MFVKKLDDKALDEMKKQFQTIDADGNGTISAQELKEALKMSGEKLSNKEINKIFKSIDENGDNLINYNEFL